MSVISLPVFTPPKNVNHHAERDPTPRTMGTVAEAMRGNQISRKLPRLSYMELILTDQCNLRCSYCFEKDKNPHKMTDQTALSSVDYLMDISGPVKQLTILFFGGEPLLRFDLMQKVWDYATERATALGKTISWDMTTNGTLMDETKARWCGEHCVKYLLSMDGGREDHNRYRRFADGRGSFDTVAHNIPIMKRHQPWMGVKMTITPESCRTLRNSIEELHSLGINQFLIGYGHGMPWTMESLKEYEESMLDLCELYLQMKYEKRYFRMSLFEEGELGEAGEHHSFGCGAGRGRFCVDSYGDIYGCSKLATITGMRNGVLPYGNVYQGQTRIENRLQFLISELGPREKCKTCEFNEVCAGGCPAVSYQHTGSIYIPDDLTCKIVFINQRVHAYMKRRHREVFNDDFDQEGDDQALQEERNTALCIEA